MVNKHYTDLGIILGPHKWCPFNEILKFIGFPFNLRMKTVTLLEKKKQKYLLQLEDAENQEKQWDLEEIDTLTGRLSHIVYVVDHGCFHLCYLYAFHASFGGDYNTRPRHVPRPIAHGFFMEINFWHKIFRNPDPIERVIQPFMPPAKICMASDASKIGIGILVGDTWDARGLQKGWDEAVGKDIGLGEEALGVLLCLEMFFDLNPGISFVKLTYLCNNDNVVKGTRRSAMPTTMSMLFSSASTGSSIAINALLS